MQVYSMYVCTHMCACVVECACGVRRVSMALCHLILYVDLYTVVCWCLYPQLLDYFAVDEDARIANLQQYAVNQVSTQCVCVYVRACVRACMLYSLLFCTYTA